jgi:hypothetical protein
MPLGILFWVLFVLGVGIGIWRGFADAPGRPYWGFGVFILVLILILGWHDFGPVVNDSGSSPSSYRSR